MHNFTDLRIAVHKETNAKAAIIALLNGLASQANTCAHNPGAVEAFARDLGASADGLADAVLTNTPLAATGGDPIGTDSTSFAFAPRTIGGKEKTVLTAPWPEKVTVAPEFLNGTQPKVKVDGDKATIYAANATATYQVEDLDADPLVLTLVPDSSTYKTAPTE